MGAGPPPADGRRLNGPPAGMLAGVQGEAPSGRACGRTTRAAAADRAAAAPSRAADVPPVGRLLRRQLADVLPRGRVQGRRRGRLRRCHRRRAPSGCGRRSTSTSPTRRSSSTSSPAAAPASRWRSPEGVRFLTRSRLFTDDELDQLEAQATTARPGRADQPGHLIA